MKRALLAATGCAAIVASALGLAYAQLQADHRQDQSPTIHGSSDQTIVPVASSPGVTPAPYPMVRPHGALQPHAVPERQERR